MTNQRHACPCYMGTMRKRNYPINHFDWNASNIVISDSREWGVSSIMMSKSFLFLEIRVNDVTCRSTSSSVWWICPGPLYQRDPLLLWLQTTNPVRTNDWVDCFSLETFVLIVYDTKAMKLTSPLVVSFFMKHPGPVYLLPRVACEKVRKKEWGSLKVSARRTY
jgi:hypothetical protein